MLNPVAPSSAENQADPRPLAVLLVEDSPDDAELIARTLRRGGFDAVIERVDTAPALSAALRRRSWDAVISDYSLPQFSGLAALSLVRESGLDLPFIIVSRVIGEHVAVAAMQAGAHDYIMKNNLTRLVPAIEREVREAEVRRQRRQAEQERAEEAEISAALALVGHELIAGLQDPAMLERLCRLSAEALCADASHTLLHDSRAGEWWVIAGHDTAQRERSGVLRWAEAEMAPIAARVAVDDVVQAECDDITASDETALARRLGARALLLMGLRRGRELIGVQIACYHGAPPAGRYARRVAAGIAQLASMALDNVRVTQELAERQRELALLESVAVAANEASVAGEAFARALEAVCAHTRWAVGTAHLLPEGGTAREPETVLRVGESWQGEDKPAVAQLRAALERLDLSARVAALADCVHVADLRSSDLGGSQYAVQLGLRGACGFPVRVGAEVVATLELFSDRVLDGQERVLALLPSVAAQLGRVVERQRAAQEIHRLNQELEQRVIERSSELAVANSDLDLFRHSVSHDLRAPLGRIDAFNQVVLEEYADRLDPKGKDYLARARATAQHMEQLIDNLLDHAVVARKELRRESFDLSTMARIIAAGLSESDPERKVTWIIPDGMIAHGDAEQVQIALEHILQNAWKYTRRHPEATIQVGVTERDGQSVCFVRDDGAGFDMAYADKLFEPFQRLHSSAEFEGNGVGLVTVKRIIERHGGQVWAEAEVEKGATFFFTLGPRDVWTIRQRRFD